MATQGRNGGKKTGGRKKGSLNKSKDEIKELLDSHVDFEEIIGKLVELVNGVSVSVMTDKGIKVYQDRPDAQAAKILLEYRFGKPQQKIEHSGELTEIVISKTVINKRGE